MKKAFTLVENMVVFTVLGIIIALVTPGMIRNNTEKKNRLLLRKSVMTYQEILNKIMSETTGITTEADMDGLITRSNCELIKAELDIETSDGCIFKTIDNVWWDTSTPSEALISTENRNALTTANANDEADRKTFYIPFIIRNDANSVKSVSILKLPNSANKTKQSALRKTSDFLIAD